jgi:hypothetical protein
MINYYSVLNLVRLATFNSCWCSNTNHIPTHIALLFWKWDKQSQKISNFILSVQVKSFCGDFFSHHPRATVQANKQDGSLRENGHIATSNGGNRHMSVRHLLSSTSSYTNSITPEDRELREIAMT